MRLRDILIVVIAVIAFIFGWIQEGSMVINNSFFIPVSDSDAAVHQMPAPIVTDLNGDGSPETLMLLTRDHLGAFPTGALKRNYDNVFVPLNHGYVAALGSPAIGIATGHLTYPDNKTQVKSGPHHRRQHIAVVTDDYHLTLYNHKLEEVWSIPLVAVQDATIIPFHASISMLPERIFEQDLGSIIVSVAIGGANDTELMAFFAVNGASGEIRWKRTINNYDVVDKMQHHNQFDTVDRLIFSENDLVEHSNELSWHHFRESVVGTLPHEYSHPWHDELRAHHFFKPKGRKKRDRALGGAGGHDQKARSVKYKSRYVQEEANDVGELGEHIHHLHKKAGAAGGGDQKHHQKHRLHPNVIVHHSKHGVQALHLYTGKVITRLMPLKAGVAYHDLDDDYTIDEVTTDIGVKQVHHHRHGMEEELHCRGVINTGVPLAETPEFNATICDTEGLLSSMSLLTHFIRGDGAEDEPRADPLALIGSKNVVHKFTRAVTPLVVQQHTAKGIGMWKVRRRAVFFVDTGLLTCMSPVSKQILWRAQTDASFDNKREAEEVSGGLHSSEELENRVRKFPHLSHYSFHAHPPAVYSAHNMHYGTDPFVIAVGNKVMAAVNARNGHVVKNIKLQAPPIAPLVIGDFNGDGTNDIIVTSANGYYGFLVERQNGGSTTSILMATTICLLGLMYAAQRAMNNDDEEGDVNEWGNTALGGGGSGTGEFSFERKHRVPVAKRSTD